jgi:hypothetical protein
MSGLCTTSPTTAPTPMAEAIHPAYSEPVPSRSASAGPSVVPGSAPIAIAAKPVTTASSGRSLMIKRAAVAIEVSRSARRSRAAAGREEAGRR